MLRAAAAAAFAAGVVDATLPLGYRTHPPCRKSPELHSMVWPDGQERLVAFGGKGFVYECVGPDCVQPGFAAALRRRAAAEPEEELASEEDLEEAEERGALSANGTLLEGLSLAEAALRRRVTMLGDTWAFSPDEDSFSQVGSSGGESPRPRWKPASTVTADKRHLVLFGGCKSTWVGGVMNDLWVLRTDSSGASWTRVYTEGPPSKRRGHIVAANSSHLIVFGGKGYDGRAHVLTDLWALPLEELNFREAGSSLSLDLTFSWKHTAAPGGAPASAWRQLATFPGEPRWGATGEVLRDASGREKLAVFGGRHLNNGGGFHSVDAHAYTYYNELWLYDFLTDSWEMAQPTGPAPHPRDHHGSTEMNGEFYVFGGRVAELRSADAVRRDLWSFSLDTGAWTEHSAKSGFAPSARYMPGVSSTVWKGKPAIAVFGGETLPGSTKTTSLNDVWIYDGESWHEASPTQCEADGARAVAAAEAQELGERLRRSLALGGVAKLQAWVVFASAAAAALVLPPLWRRLRLRRELLADAAYVSLS